MRRRAAVLPEASLRIVLLAENLIERNIDGVLKSGKIRPIIDRKTVPNTNRLHLFPRRIRDYVEVAVQRLHFVMKRAALASVATDAK